MSRMLRVRGIMLDIDEKDMYTYRTWKKRMPE